MVRFGIVGFGLHAVKRLMPGFRLSEKCTVTALSRRDLGRAEASAREFKIAHAFNSTEDLCRCPDVDAVFVTSPNVMHRMDVLTALRLGKPVLCEKPMGMHADQCREMVKAAQKAHLSLGVAQVFRFHESTRRIRERLAEKQIGRVIFARSEFSYPGRNHARTWLNDKSVAGGGPIADVGVHCIDALRFVLQDEVVQVHARTVTDLESGDVEAAAVLTLLFRSGILGSVAVSTRAQYRTPVEFVGEEGSLFADNGFTVERPVTLELRREGHDEESETVDNHLSYARQVDAFAETLETGKPFPAPGEDGWQNQAILDAAFRSAESGEMEKVTPIGF